MTLPPSVPSFSGAPISGAPISGVPASPDVTAAAPYLLAWRLEGRRVLVVGGGEIGTGKIETLLETKADIVVVDPQPSDRIVDLADRKVLRLRKRMFRPTDVARAALVVAATGDTKTNRWIRRCAKVRGAVVNAVDDKPNCDVTVPAVIRRGPATIAITTGGATPAGARFLREEISKAIDHGLPEHVGALLDTAASVRSTLRHEGAYRFDYAGWRQRFFEPAKIALFMGSGPEVIAQHGERFIEEERALYDQVRPGSVVLVGAGPGGADLITVRGSRELAKADVVVYDRLADPALLALAPVVAERIPVGKGKGFGVAQQDIIELLIERARGGARVVRLKGGDPFVFGRGSEEAEAIVAAGIAVDVVPGISSALGGPALAGISLTDRRFSSSFTVITGHNCDRSDSDWEHLARHRSTVVVLMAASTADAVATRLIAAGRPATEPVAFVHQAGRSDQDTARRTLAEVAADGCPFPSPTVMVVGTVAGQSHRQQSKVSNRGALITQPA